MTITGQATMRPDIWRRRAERLDKALQTEDTKGRVNLLADILQDIHDEGAKNQMKINSDQALMLAQLTELLDIWEKHGCHPNDAFTVLMRACLAYKVTAPNGAADWAEILKDETELRQTAERVGLLPVTSAAKDAN